MSVLRRLYGSLVLGLMVTLFWIVGGFSLLFLLGEERWGGWFLILSILAISLVVSSVIFTKFTRQERSEQRVARAHAEQEARVAAIPPAIRLEEARSSLKLAEEARRDVAAAQHQLRLQYESCEPTSYQDAEASLRQAREWIDELVADLQPQADLGDPVELSPPNTPTNMEKPSRETAEAAVQSMRTVFQAYSSEPSPESVETAIRSARNALSQVSRNTSNVLVLNAAEEALLSAQSWAAMALTAE